MVSTIIKGVVDAGVCKIKSGLLSHKKRVLLRKYQSIQPTYISNIGLYHAMYSRYMFMKCKWWMTYGQGRLISKIGPGQSSTLTEINCKWSIKLNIYFLYWYFQQNQCLKIKNKNYAVYNIHRLAWGSFACGTTGQDLSIVPIRPHCVRLL